MIRIFWVINEKHKQEIFTEVVKHLFKNSIILQKSAYFVVWVLLGIYNTAISFKVKRVKNWLKK